MIYPTDEQIDKLLNDLDGLARDHDGYEYGLPVIEYPGCPLPKLREAVRTWFDATNNATPVEQPETVARSVQAITRYIDAMSPAEFRASLVRAGIVGADGKLTQGYRREG